MTAIASEGQAPKQILGFEAPSVKLLTSALTVQRDLRKRGSAQRWAATYSHGGVLLGSSSIV